jgi:hypothetical protein
MKEKSCNEEVAGNSNAFLESSQSVQQFERSRTRMTGLISLTRRKWWFAAAWRIHRHQPSPLSSRLVQCLALKLYSLILAQCSLEQTS